MTRLDRLTLGLLIATVAFLALVLVFARVQRWLDRRYLRKEQRKADERLAPYWRDQQRRKP